MECHYSLATREFSRSFVVGPSNDCCVASAGLAKGVAFATFARARSDVRKARPIREGRGQIREEKESREEAYIQSYIRQLRSGMKGAKGSEKTGV
eukprot:2158742-Pleurochrysis_carterae.AAC.1